MDLFKAGESNLVFAYTHLFIFQINAYKTNNKDSAYNNTYIMSSRLDNTIEKDEKEVLSLSNLGYRITNTATQNIQ